MPQKLRSACSVPGCPNAAYKAGRCEQHYREWQRGWDSRRAKTAERGYSSVWRRLRQLKLRRQPLCEDCLAKGITTPAVLVHHARPINEGGKVLPSLNELVSLCEKCHGGRHRN
jgi:5-methylcytosine-specific restriction endonuclease McrA